MRFKKAFTMAEAILVMTILGIIATVMISTLKPAQYKERALQVAAKSIYSEIDSAMTQILTDYTRYNKLSAVYPLNGTTGSTTYNFNSTNTNANVAFLALMKNYMATARGTVPSACTSVSATYNMLLKNGACLAVKTGAYTGVSMIPGEKTETASATYDYGVIFLDVNGNDEPNVLGKDRYYIPLDENGIVQGS